MAKAVHWQIPFQSINKTNYRIDIYGNYFGNRPPLSWPVELQAGENPFVVSEDDSDDVFEPIRAKTGTIQIADTDDRIVNIYPQNNTSNHVRLIRITGNTEQIVEEGFLSCESYEQSYVGHPQNFELSYNGILESMDSIHIDEDIVDVGLVKVRNVLYSILQMVIDKGANIEGIYFDYSSYNILDKYIDTSVLYDRVEKYDEFQTNYIYDGKSCKEALRRIAVFMGMCIREDGKRISFQRIGSDSDKMYFIDMNTLINPQGRLPYIARGTKQISDIEDNNQWFGADHTRNINQGAKSVEVVCDLEKYDMESLKLPATPPVNLWEGEKKTVSQSSGFSSEKLYCNHGMVISNASEFSRYKVTTVQREITQIEDATEQDVFDNSVLKVGRFTPYASMTRSVGSFLARVDTFVGENKYARLTGLYMACLASGYNHGQCDENNHIYVQKSIYKYTLIKGYLKFDMAAFQITDTDAQLNGPVVGPFGGRMASYIPDPDVNATLYASIRFGNKYFNGGNSKWVDNFAIVGMQFKDGKAYNYHKRLSDEDGFFIPIDETMSGDIEVRFYPFIKGEGYTVDGYDTRVVDLLISKMEISYSTDDFDDADKDSNNYYQVLGTNFSDEISIKNDLASYLVSDIPSSSIIMEDEETPMEELEYGIAGEGEMRRPERDLINRLAAYYGRSRYRLMLEIKPLQIDSSLGSTIANLVLVGLESQQKMYLPMASSMDYYLEQEKLTCLEIRDSSEND